MFTDYVADREIATQDLKAFSDAIEELRTSDGQLGYKLKRTQAGDSVSWEKVCHRCKTLMSYTWHSRDYLKNILMDNGIKDLDKVGQLLNKHIGKSRELQICSYLTNDYKHAGVNQTQKWATDLAPRYGDIYVYGFMESFPRRMKPTYWFTRKKEVEFELTGFAEINGQKYPFTDFEWLVSCVIEDQNGKVLGDATSICERGFHTWIQVLRENGVELREFDPGWRINADSLLIQLSNRDSQ